MFNERGIGRDEFAWIERDQFAYYMTIAYLQSDPADWATFRRALLGALVAAFGLWDSFTGADRRTTDRDGIARQHQVLQLLDRVRARYDPAVNWAGFLLELWDRHRELRLGEPINRLGRRGSCGRQCT